MKPFALLLIASSLAVITSPASAAVIVFDELASFSDATNDIKASSVGGSLDLSPYGYDLSLEAKYSIASLAWGATFTRSQLEESRVIIDLLPEKGGIGADAGNDGIGSVDTDNLESNLQGNANYDEIVFFDFGSTVSLNSVNFNAGEGSGHQDSYSGQSDIFDIFYSLDYGVTYQSILAANASPSDLNTYDNGTIVAGLYPTDGEYIDLSVTGESMYWAVANVGPNGSEGGYIEKIEYSVVPVPATLALFGLGLLGLGVARRKAQA